MALTADDVKPGCLYRGRDEADKYVIEVAPPKGRFMARVLWRRPGKHAARAHWHTIEDFIRNTIRKLDDVSSVEPAPALPNDGMAAKAEA